MNLNGLEPSDLAFDDITSWRPGQLESAERIVNSKRDRIVLQAPTGAGKSVIIRVPGQVTGQRTLILTRTIDLQKQYESQGVTTLFGRRHYLCTKNPVLSAADGVCRLGERCQFMQDGCAYFEDKRIAHDSDMTSLNYSYFFREGTFTDYDWIMCDEGHGVPSELTSAFEIHINLYDLKQLGLTPPTRPDMIRSWVEWAPPIEKKLRRKAKFINRDKAPYIHHVNNALNRLGFIHDLSNWIIEFNGKVVDIRPIWPTDLANEALFQAGRKFVFTSATIDPLFTMQMLGVDIRSVDVIRMPSQFPIENRPIFTQLADHRPRFAAAEEEYQAMIQLIDYIVEAYPNKRGLIHTGSYALAERIVRLARNKTRIVSHDKDTRQMVLKTFRETQGAVLVTPSMAEGINLPYDECEFIIIAKMPYPNLGSNLWQARFASDEAKAQFAYSSEAISLVVQACGRGVRAMDDHCDTYILDLSFLRELSRNQHLFPQWFTDAIQRI